MNITRFIRNNLSYYWKKHLLLALGVAVSGAVITGALMVGDSVSYSLNRIVDQRLGRVTHVLKSVDRYFTSELARQVQAELNIPVSSLLLQEGSAIAGGGQARINRVSVIGVDGDFDTMAGLGGYYGSLSGDSVIISRNLANRLNVAAGDEVLLRVERASLIPLNAPFVSDAGNVVTLRAAVVAVADEEKMGRFNLKVSQTAPFNVFMSRRRLQELIDFEDRANVMLFDADGGPDAGEIMRAVDSHFSVADAGLKVRYLADLNRVEVTSDRVFIEDILTPYLEQAAGPCEGIVTYFVNRLETGGRSTPYSFVSTLPAHWLREDEILISEWLAADLSAGKGDTVRVTYFEVGPLRELNEVSARFVVKAVIPMEGRFGDRSLMPDIPGLSDVRNCRDWDTGVPIELESIRDRDEDYWDRYGGLPKAFVSVSRGGKLWENRFGTYTAFRYELAGDTIVNETAAAEMDLLGSSLMDRVEPGMLGFTLESVRDKGREAAASGVDFSQLFAGLSFFLLLAGILLTILLFLLNVESREGQLRTLVVMGIPVRTIRKIIFSETVVVALTGALAGLLLAVIYNILVFKALNGVWRDVVRTEMMHVDIRAMTLVTGWAIAMAVAIVSLWIPLNRRLRRYSRSHLQTSATATARKRRRGRKLAILVSIVTVAAAVLLIGSQLVRMEVVNVPVFFTAGGLLLISAVSFFIWYLWKMEHTVATGLDLAALSWKNATRNRTRSMSIVILFAIGAFLVISTGSNRKDLFAASGDPGSGTGGFLYYAESTIPVLQQLNENSVRYEYGLGDGYSFVQLRVADGDDASCLNLNRIVNPKVLGVDPGDLEGRFSFVTRTGYLDEEYPWQSLSKELPGGLIPAIADETVIKWGLGLQVGDTLHYTGAGGGSMELLLIGGLAPSIFQGSVIIAAERFLEEFPESSGTQVFLLDGEVSDTALITTETGRGFRDLGWDMQLAPARLAEFYSVTNAYLSIFQVMGALGLLLGTFGLVVVLSRSILERRQEIALLKAVGYGRRTIRRMVTREYMILLMAGIITGFATAVIATLPSIASAHTGTSFTSILLWLAILVLNGWAWIELTTWSALGNPEIYKVLRNE